MMRRHGHLHRSSLLVADIVAATAAAVIAYIVRFESGWIAVEGRLDVLPAQYLRALPATVAVLVIAARLRNREPPGTRRDSIAHAMRAGLLGALLLATLVLFYRDVFQYSRLAVVIVAGLYVPSLLAARAGARAIVRRLRQARQFRTPAAVVAGGAPAMRLARALASTPWSGVHVVAVLELGGEVGAWPAAERLDGLGALFRQAQGSDVTEVYVALPAERAAELPSLLEGLAQTTVDVRVVPDLGDAVLLNADAHVLAGLPMVSVRERPLYGAHAAAKRAVDVLVAAMLLVALLPLLLLIAAIVRLTSVGPVLFRQERMGLDGRAFEMLKFRSMPVDAEANTGPVFATINDPRATRVGRVLRRLSLDELPQLWNVLRGEMSLVGPRPERQSFIDDFRRRFPGYMLRHAVRSGMTGWAQVNGLRGDSSLEDRLQYDIEYIDSWSLLLDAEILGRTAVQVVIGKNAY